jgi:hypothetical protein
MAWDRALPNGTELSVDAAAANKTYELAAGIHTINKTGCVWHSMPK